MLVVKEKGIKNENIDRTSQEILEGLKGRQYTFKKEYTA